ncbi:hypothetical protein RB653_004977 [Dictyostelium firmibasis]|uniref:Uncharacterized protein n=1 Tax=Dictyostelium firmibasis TaxID=79012 RepID=A0AAN7YSN6_9MYCE
MKGNQENKDIESFKLSESITKKTIERNSSPNRIILTIDNKDFEDSLKIVFNYIKKKINEDKNSNKRSKRQKVNIKKQENLLEYTYEDVYEKSIKNIITYINKNSVDRRQAKLLFKILMVSSDYVPNRTKYKILDNMKLKQGIDDYSLFQLISSMNVDVNLELYIIKSGEWISRWVDILNDSVLSSQYQLFFKLLEYLTIGKSVVKILCKITKRIDCLAYRFKWLKQCCPQTKFYHLKPILEVYERLLNGSNTLKPIIYYSNGEFNGIDDFSSKLDKIIFPELIGDTIVSSSTKNNQYSLHYLSLSTFSNINIERLRNWVSNSLPLLTFHSKSTKDKGSLVSLDGLLKALVKLSDFTLESFPEIDNFLVSFFRVWKGDGNRKEILKLFSRINMCSFSHLFKHFLRPLHCLFEFKDFQFQMDLLECFNYLLLHWLSSDWIKCWSRHVHKRPLFTKKTLNVQYYPTIIHFINYFNSLATIALIHTNDHPLTQHWVIQFFNSCSMIATKFQLPFAIPPPVNICQRLIFLSTHSIPTNRMANVLLNFRQDYSTAPTLTKINHNLPIRELFFKKTPDLKSQQQSLFQFSNFFLAVLKNLKLPEIDHKNSIINNYNNHFFNQNQDQQTFNNRVEEYQTFSIVNSIAFYNFYELFQLVSNSDNRVQYINYLNDLGFNDLFEFILN